LPQASAFNYLGTTIDQERGRGAGIAKRIEKAGIDGELSGVLCDKKIPKKLKDLLQNMAIKPTLMYGNKIWPMTQGQEEDKSN